MGALLHHRNNSNKLRRVNAALEPRVQLEVVGLMMGVCPKARCADSGFCNMSTLDEPTWATLERELQDITALVQLELAHSAVGKDHPFKAEPEFAKCVYADNNASTPIYPGIISEYLYYYNYLKVTDPSEVASAMAPYLTTHFGNPSSPHVYGTGCKRGLQNAREHVRAMVNAQYVEEITFTASGTECDNRAIDIALHHYSCNAPDKTTYDTPLVAYLS